MEVVAHVSRAIDVVELIDQPPDWSNYPEDDSQKDGTVTRLALLTGGWRCRTRPMTRGALVQIGNLPYNQRNCIHTVEDVGSFASSGPTEAHGGRAQATVGAAKLGRDLVNVG